MSLFRHPERSRGPLFASTVVIPSVVEGPLFASTVVIPSAVEGPLCATTVVIPSAVEGPLCATTVVIPSAVEGPLLSIRMWYRHSCLCAPAQGPHYDADTSKLVTAGLQTRAFFWAVCWVVAPLSVLSELSSRAQSRDLSSPLRLSSRAQSRDLSASSRPPSRRPVLKLTE